MHPDVIIASRPQAERLLISGNPRSPIRHVISIGAPGDPTPPGFELCANGLRLEFHDDTGDIGPQREHVEKVIDFGRQVEHEGGRLLVHCEAGISRSSAAALTVFATWLGADKEQEAVDRIYAAQPYAWPNSQLVRHADELLGNKWGQVLNCEFHPRIVGAWQDPCASNSPVRSIM